MIQSVPAFSTSNYTINLSCPPLILHILQLIIIFCLLQSASEESLTEEDLKVVQGGGARICSTHHRPPPSAISSTTSSSASVATNGGSTTALIHHNKKSKKNYNPRIIPIHNLQKHNIYNKSGKMTTGVQKELNLLLTTPHVPDISMSDDSDVCKSKSGDEGTIAYIDTDVEAGEKRLSNGLHKDSSDESRQGHTLNEAAATDKTQTKKRLTFNDLIPQVSPTRSRSLHECFSNNGLLLHTYCKEQNNCSLISFTANYQLSIINS